MGFAEVPPTTKVWFNGKLIDWKDATVHIMTHALHYGTAQFEGIRCYLTPQGSFVFRLDDHVKRLFESCKIYRIPISYSRQEITEAVLEVIRANEHKACYIRPIIFRGTGAFGVNPLDNSVETAICTWEWGKYLGEDALEKGVSVQVSSWNRFAPNTIPAMAKCAGNYANSQLIKMEALLNGFDEGIALDTNGYVSEGSGENIFVVRDGVVYTPAMGSSILTGFTRDAIVRLLGELDIELVFTSLSREFLYLADEVFFTGTAAEVTPVTKIDHIPVGSGLRGPITGRMQERFFALINGEIPDKHGWLTSVY